MYVIIFLIQFFSSSSCIFFNSQHYGEWFYFLLQGEGKERASNTGGPLGVTDMVQGLRLLLQSAKQSSSPYFIMPLEEAARNTITSKPLLFEDIVIISKI
jgi:hypothetical protein